MDIRLDVDTRGIEQFAQGLEDELSKLVRKTAFAIEGDAKTRAPVDTGALRASIYTVTSDGGSSRVPQGVEAAGPVERPSSPTEAVVAVGVNYAPYVEYGTRHTAAQPFLMPAGVAKEGPFLDEAKRLIAEQWSKK
jgi:HK97 gp10 family phage protein